MNDLILSKAMLVCFQNTNNGVKEKLPQQMHMLFMKIALHNPYIM